MEENELIKDTIKFLENTANNIFKETHKHYWDEAFFLILKLNKQLKSNIKMKKEELLERIILNCIFSELKSNIKMKKEEIYLVLSKLSESERKEVFELLPPEENKDYDYVVTGISCYLHFENYWIADVEYRLCEKKEITFNQFKELFKPKEKLSNIKIDLPNHRDYSLNETQINELKQILTIQLDKTKAYDLRDLNEEQFLIIQKEFQKQGGWDIMPYVYREKYIHVYFNECRWYSDKNDREVINALTLFEPQLKIGDTFEHNGFICEVKEPVNKWVYNKSAKRYLKTSVPNNNETEITDQDFINQLEKHAR